MIVWRISKFDPEVYSPNGYGRDEWTSISDIGREFYDGIFTMEQYIKTEASYLNVVEAFVSRCPADSLKLSYLEQECAPVDKAAAQFHIGQGMSVAQVKEFIRACLREEVWGRVRSGSDFFLNTGYDYYLYIGFPSTWQTSEMIDVVEREGLFIQDYSDRLASTDMFEDPVLG